MFSFFPDDIDQTVAYDVGSFVGLDKLDIYKTNVDVSAVGELVGATVEVYNQYNEKSIYIHEIIKEDLGLPTVDVYVITAYANAETENESGEIDSNFVWAMYLPVVHSETMGLPSGVYVSGLVMDGTVGNIVGGKLIISK